MSNTEKRDQSLTAEISTAGVAGSHDLTAAHYRAMLDSSLDLVDMLSPTGEILYISPNVRTILGYEPAEVIGLNCFDLIHPDDHPPIQEAFDNTLADGESPLITYRVRKADGSWCWLESLATNFLHDSQIQAIVAHSRDVTQQKQAESELQRSHQELQSVLNTITDAFTILDHDWRIVTTNVQAEVMLGRTREELLGKSIWELYPESVGSSFYHAYHRARNEQVAVEVEDYSPPLGKWLAANIYPSERGLSVYVRDITKRKSAELDREKLLRQQENERQQLDTLLRQLPVGVIVAEAPSGKLLLGNEQVAQIWRRPFVASSNISEYSHWPGFHADGTPLAVHEWPLARSITQGEVIVNEEVEILRGDGTRAL
jgi:PAS domain S-box-containing protein